MLSSGGKLTLINSVLTTVPLYTLSIYQVPKTILLRINKIRRKFLWQGTAAGKRKYYLVNWSKACLAKKYGGLGILNLRFMNIALLLKWWWKLKDNSYSSVWKTVIIYKYYTHREPLSPFWATIHKLEYIGLLSVRYEPGINTTLSFWHDLWYARF